MVKTPLKLMLLLLYQYPQLLLWVLLVLLVVDRDMLFKVLTLQLQLFSHLLTPLVGLLKILPYLLLV
jgi:hypothetical protein